jgi:hypothetical protein
MTSNITFTYSNTASTSQLTTVVATSTWILSFSFWIVQVTSQFASVMIFQMKSGSVMYCADELINAHVAAALLADEMHIHTHTKDGAATRQLLTEITTFSAAEDGCLLGYYSLVQDC